MKDKFQMVGTKINEFSLPNNFGDTIPIRSYLGKSNVVVILLRDILWPFCRAHVKKLAADYEKFVEKNVALYPILVDNLNNAQRMHTTFAKRKFPIFYDSDENIAKKVLNQEWKIFKLGRMPALIVVDKNQIIHYAHYGDNMHDIPENEEVLAVLDRINNNK